MLKKWIFLILLIASSVECKLPSLNSRDVKAKIEENGFELLHVSFEDTLVISTLPFLHRDPFDRIIIAQGISNNFTIISKDPEISKYKVKVLW